MNKQTKTLLTIGGVAVVGFILYKQFAKPKSFVGDPIKRNPFDSVRKNKGLPICQQECIGGKCYVADVNTRGDITGYKQYNCKGTRFEDIQF